MKRIQAAPNLLSCRISFFFKKTSHKIQFDYQTHTKVENIIQLIKIHSPKNQKSVSNSISIYWKKRILFRQDFLIFSIFNLFAQWLIWNLGTSVPLEFCFVDNEWIKVDLLIEFRGSELLWCFALIKKPWTTTRNFN